MQVKNKIDRIRNDGGLLERADKQISGKATMKTVAMLLSNAFRPDPRVHKEACSLAQAGYKVTVVSWDRKGELAPRAQQDGFEVHRIKVRSAYGAGLRQLLYLPRFWLLVWRELVTLRPDIVHCHDLDTTPVGYAYARLHRIPWVFDAHEAYPEATTNLQVGCTIHHLLTFLERYMARRATHILTVGNLLAQRFTAMGARVSVVGNYSPLSTFTMSSAVTRADLGINTDDNHLLVVYIGSLLQARAIVPLLEATQYVNNVTVLLIGDGPQRRMLEARLPDYPQVRYLGGIPLEQVPAYTTLADVIYYGLIAADANNQYSAPNALFNALAAGKPVLALNVGEIAQIVCAEQCGIVVTRSEPEAIAQAVEQLREADLRHAMALNARRAAETKYNWGVAEATLLDVYAELAAN